MGDPWLNDENTVFGLLGVGEQEVSLRNLIRGQRIINGKFYEAINHILDSLQQISPGTAQGGQESQGAWTESLSLARKTNEEAPGPPPGCAKPPSGGS